MGARAREKMFGNLKNPFVLNMTKCAWQITLCILLLSFVAILQLFAARGMGDVKRYAKLIELVGSSQTNTFENIY